MVAWRTRPASTADVEAVAALRAEVLRADLERLGRYDEHRVWQRLRDGFTPAYTRVNVLRHSPARRLYERHGFVLEAEDAVDVFMVRPAPNGRPAGDLSSSPPTGPG